MDKKKDNSGGGIVLLVFFLVGIIAFAYFMTRYSTGTAALYGVIVGMLAALITSLILPASAKSKKKKEREKLKASGILNVVHGDHMAGLPIAEGAECDIYEYIDRFVFKSSGTEITLEKRKITDVSIKTDKEISANYVSSIGGAVAGAALFGPLGAMVGGRAKQKNSTIVYHYLILTYLKDESVDYVSFDVTESLEDATEIYNGYINRPGRTEPRVAVKL